MNIFKLLVANFFLLASITTFANEISVIDPYVRDTPPGLTVSASFLTIKNGYNKDIALVEVTGDIAKNIELHEHTNNDGMMEMRQVSKIIIPANGTTQLKPSGYHIMLIGLTRPIKTKDLIDLTLVFDNGDKQVIKAEVKKIMTTM